MTSSRRFIAAQHTQQNGRTTSHVDDADPVTIDDTFAEELLDLLAELSVHVSSLDRESGDHAFTAGRSLLLLLALGFVDDLFDKHLLCLGEHDTHQKLDDFLAEVRTWRVEEVLIDVDENAGRGPGVVVSALEAFRRGPVRIG